jgi:hypothetical protein
MRDPLALQPGDVVRPHTLGQVSAKPNHTLVVLFLGACREDQEPNVPEYLRSVGFTRSHCFEVTLYWSEWDVGECAPINVEEYSSALLTTAETPREAVEGAVRYALAARARVEANRVDGRGILLRGLTVGLMRLGPIGPDGKPHNGRGRVFASWSAESGEPLEKILEQTET